ncbi:MAG: CDP-glucose 4,6-dehydratase [Promethearchaeota archaeon]
MGLVSELKDFFRDKKVLITGHTGFMGSWLAIWLNELNANVIGYALPPYTENDNFIVTNLETKIQHFIGDVRDYDKLKEIFLKYKPQIIFHLAAQPIVRKSYRIPKETYDINVGGTVNVFEAFRKTEDSKILINITTDKCYENQEWIWGYRENDKLGGHDPYSSSKACSELITSSYQRSFFKLKNYSKMVSSARSGNVIGGGDWQEDRLVPDFFRAIKSNVSLKIRNPKSIRPWQHVLEPIRGYLLLARKMWDGNEKYASAWNFGPNKNSIFTVEEVIKELIKYSGRGSYVYSQENSDELHESQILMLDCMKAYRYLKWSPVLSMEDTIKLVCEWYMENEIDYDFDVKQINQYLKKVI